MCVFFGFYSSWWKVWNYCKIPAIVCELTFPSATFCSVSLLNIFAILTMMCHGDFLLCLCIFGVLNGSYIWMSTLFSMFENFSAIILLNNSCLFSVYLCSFYQTNSRVWSWIFFRLHGKIIHHSCSLFLVYVSLYYCFPSPKFVLRHELVYQLIRCLY